MCRNQLSSLDLESNTLFLVLIDTQIKLSYFKKKEVKFYE